MLEPALSSAKLKEPLSYKNRHRHCWRTQQERLRTSVRTILQYGHSHRHNSHRQAYQQLRPPLCHYLKADILAATLHVHHLEAVSLPHHASILKNILSDRLVSALESPSSAEKGSSDFVRSPSSITGWRFAAQLPLPLLHREDRPSMSTEGFISFTPK